MHQTLVKGLAALALLIMPLATPSWAQPVDPMAPTPPTIPTLPEAGEIPMAEIPLAPVAPEAPEAVEGNYGHNISIEGTPEFVEQSVALLDRLAALPTGKALLEQLGATGQQTVIRLTEDDNAYASPLDYANASDASYDAEGKAGAGTDALVQWNPELELEGFTPEIIMGHELIHALHIHKGELNLTVQDEGANMGTRLEELRTIGTDGFEDEVLSENALRQEWNAAYPDQRVPTTRTGHGASDFAPEEEGAGPSAQNPGDPNPGDVTAPMEAHPGHSGTSPCAGCSHKGLSDILKQHFGGQK